MRKPKLTFWQIWNMSFGFLGIQFGFALQNANASRILQTFGADVEHLSWFWLVAPITGLIVQPIIGHYSDQTWNRLGRRKPYFLTGALLASIALILMPNSPHLALLIPPMFIGAGMLMVMDASINVAMEPFRALVADMLPDNQRTLGFSIQTFLIGIGAVAGSWLPWVLFEIFDVGNTGSVNSNEVTNDVLFSFYTGAVVLTITIIWTVIRTKEYSPEELASFQGEKVEEEENPGFTQIFKDFADMPDKMKKLGVVQFLSWFALFSMWVFTSTAVSQHVFDVPIGLKVDDLAPQKATEYMSKLSETMSSDQISSYAIKVPDLLKIDREHYDKAGNWVGILFGIYNAISALYALLLPKISGSIGRKKTHAFSLIMGGLGLTSMLFISNQYVLILSMIGVGFAWASILAMPYAMLAGAIPVKKMGIYMGIFNFFIVIPQIVNGVIGGPIVKYLYGSYAIYALVAAGVFMILGAVAVMFVEDDNV